MSIAVADIVIAAVLVLALVLGARSGLVKSLAGLIVVVCSAVGATFSARLLAPAVESWLGPMLSRGLTEKAQDLGQSAASASAGDLLEKFGFSGAPLRELTDRVLQDAAQTGQSVVDGVVNTVTGSISYAAVFLVSFLVLLVVLTLVVKALDLVTELPGIHAANAIGGAVLGLAKGALLVFFVVWVLRRLQLVITPEMVEQSTVLAFFANNSPLSFLTGL